MPDPNPVPLAALLAQDAWACLAFERSRAPAFGHALRQWRMGQQRRLQRLRRLGTRGSTVLLQAERACLDAGLALGGSGPGRCAPWHLDEALLDAPLSALPRHPLIDPAWLAARWDAGSCVQPALPALTRLLAEPVACAHAQAPGATAAGPPGAVARIAVCLHLYYPDTWPEFAAAFDALPEAFDLFVTMPAFAAHPVLDEIPRRWPQARIVAAANRGRDVLPFLRLLAAGELDRYEWVCKLHSKKSPHMRAGQEWRQRLLGDLLGPRNRLADLLTELRAQPTCGLWAPAAHWMAGDDPRWLGTNARSMRRLRELTGLAVGDTRPPFVAGTMFWVRPAALNRLRCLGSQPEVFEPEVGQTDGTLAHAVERGFALDVLTNRVET